MIAITLASKIWTGASRRRERMAPAVSGLSRLLAMLRNKKIENPWKKHDNIPS